MKTTFCAALLALAVSSALAAPVEREQDRWNLADIYPTVDAWNTDHARVDAQLGEVAACKGKLGESAKKLKECLDLQYDVLKRYYRMAVYANELSAEDTGNSANLGLRQKSQVQGSSLSEANSYAQATPSSRARLPRPPTSVSCWSTPSRSPRTTRSG